jgi:hypothetical protein
VISNRFAGQRTEWINKSFLNQFFSRCRLLTVQMPQLQAPGRNFYNRTYLPAIATSKGYLFLSYCMEKLVVEENTPRFSNEMDF